VDPNLFPRDKKRNARILLIVFGLLILGGVLLYVYHLGWEQGYDQATRDALDGLKQGVCRVVGC
jgi:hypothetical protein